MISLDFGSDHAVLSDFVLELALNLEFVAQLGLSLSLLKGGQMVFVGNSCLNHGLLTLLCLKTLLSLSMLHVLLQFNLQFEILSRLINGFFFTPCGLFFADQADCTA